MRRRSASQIDPRRAGNLGGTQAGRRPARRQHTTHYSIADRFGNAVAVTYTLNDWFGARVTAAGTGVLLNDEMDDFTAKAGVPNMYGLVQGEANKIEPGKRPLSSMTPDHRHARRQTLDDSRHAGRQPHHHRRAAHHLNVIDYGMNIQEAVDAPRIHQQWLPEETFVETRALSPDTRAITAEHGTQAGRAAARESCGGDPDRRTIARREAGRESQVLWGARSQAEYGPGPGLLSLALPDSTLTSSRFFTRS